MSRHPIGAFAAPFLLLAACATAGGDGDLAAIEAGAEVGRSLRAAPARAAEAGTARFEVVVSTSDGEETLALTTTGSADGAAGELAMELDVRGLLGDVPDDELPPGLGEPARVVIADQTIYLRIPLLDELTGTSGWLAASRAELAAPRSSAPGGGRGVYDPFALLDLLRGVTDDVESEGHDEVRGVPTTRYSASVHLDDALALVPDDRRDALQAQLDRLDVAAGALAVKVWVGDDGLVRRLAMAIPGPAATDEDDEVTVTITIELFDYGQPVSIAVPPPDEVTPYGEAMAAMARAFLEAGA